MKVFAIVGGHRNTFLSDEINSVISNLNDLDSYSAYISELGREKRVSNSEVAAFLAAFGAKREGCDVELFRLNEMIDERGTANDRCSDLISRLIGEAEGLIIATPLHFGNPSSYLMRFLQLLSTSQQFPLSGKVVGHVTVGARRNGGQEAGNIFGLFECAQLGAVIVGDGPPFSQSGGVMESRHAEDALKDLDGVQSCLRIGSRIVRALNVLKGGELRDTAKVRLAIITDSLEAARFASENILPIVESNGKATGTVVNLEDYAIERCIGCSTCPIETASPYRCIVEDRMVELEPIVANADGIIVCLEARSSLWSSYAWQTFIERSRYLRRDNYRFANKPITSIQYCRNLDVTPFHIRIIPPCFKHDMLFIGPTANVYEELVTRPATVQQLTTLVTKFVDVSSSAAVGRMAFPYTAMYKEEARRYV